MTIHGPLIDNKKYLDPIISDKVEHNSNESDFSFFLWWILSQCPCLDRNMDGAREILSISLDIKGEIRIHMHQALQSVKTNNIIHRLDLLSRCLRQLILQKRKTPRLDILLAAATCLL